MLYHKGHPVDVLICTDDVVHDVASAPSSHRDAQGFPRRRHHVYLRQPSGGTALPLVPSHHDHATSKKIGIMPEADRWHSVNLHRDCTTITAALMLRIFRKVTLRLELLVIDIMCKAAISVAYCAV